MASVSKIRRSIRRAFNENIQVFEEDRCIRLEGKVNSWDDVIKAGYLAAKGKQKGVVNHVLPHHYEIKSQNFQKEDKDLEAMSIQEAETIPCDVLVIGAGIIGSAIARELKRYQIDVRWVDKEYDIAIHTSSRNDGMIHPGIAAKAGTLKSKMNVRGNWMYEKVSKELDVPINRCGSYILFTSPFARALMPYFWIKSKVVGIKEIHFMGRRALLKAESQFSNHIKWGVYLPTAGVTSPYKMALGYAENAVSNGAVLHLNTEVQDMILDGNDIKYVVTNKGIFQPQIVVNAAGVHADDLADMAKDRFYTIHPRKGEVALLDRKKSDVFSAIAGIIGQGNSKHSKGGGVVKTLEGNLLVGPNAFEIMEKEDYSVDTKRLNEMLDLKMKTIEGISKADVITYFSGIRAATYKEDFIIEFSERCKNLYHVAGIQSPGLASAPAIAEKVANDIQERLKAPVNETFNPYRKGIPNLTEMKMEARKHLIKEKPEYGEIICRCEEISKGEILDALNTPIPVSTIDGVKRRVRAGMGRCQGGFCMPLVMEIISEWEHLDFMDVHKKDEASTIVVSKTKEVD